MKYISLSDIKRLNLKNVNNNVYINHCLIKYKDYFDNIFKGIDNIILDKEQRIAILTDDDYNLIIAGAGSGKTTTMAAKVKFLVEIKKINPNDIIVISYTNKAVLELKERINKDFKINVLITTFHKFGLDILKKHKKVKIINNPYDIIKNYFNTELCDKNLSEFLEFFIYYFDIPKFALKFNTLNDYFNYIKKFDYLTLKGRMNKYIYEKLNSNEEVMVANFLYLNNIEYEYNIPYNNEYTPDFTIKYNDRIIYLELYNLNLYKGFDKLKYLYKINKIKNLHKLNNTDLIELYESKDLLDILKKELLKRNIKLKPKSDKEILNRIKELTKDKYYQRFILFCIKFIEMFKTNGYTKETFIKLKEKYNDKRSMLFLNFIENVYDYYQNELKKNNLIDFEDMINEAYLNLDNSLNYKYIIIDEFQDISVQRFKLIEKISKLSNAKIVAVGDDFQSIFAFAGSNISLFTNLKDKAKILKITNTYRNSQQLIDVAGSFVMNNENQINKKLISKKNINKPINIIMYENQNKMLNYCLDEIYKLGDNQKILILGRYNFLKNNLKYNKDLIISDEIKSKKYPNFKIDFLSVHASKGLGYDQVIILNCENSLYGFPSLIKDDPIMDMVLNKENYKFAEERRLFYVALTRTKNNVYILTPALNPSDFVLEIMKSKNVNVINKISKKSINVCPKCGFPLIKKYDKEIGFYYKCSNAKELCNFKCNNLLYLINIKKCPKCNGYLIVKKYNDNYFIGCTNCKYKEKI